MDVEHHCEQVNELLPWYVNRSLQGSDAEIVRAHLDDCQACRGEAEWLAQVGGHLRGTPLKTTREGKFDDLRFRIEKETRQASRARSVPGFAMAAGLLLVLAVTTGIFVASYALAPRYRTVTDAVSPAASSVMLEVTLQQEAPLSSLRDVLAQYHAEIVDGPDANGKLLLEFRLAEDENPADLRRRLEADARVANLSRASDQGNQPRQLGD